MMNLKEIVGILHLPIGNIILLIDAIYLIDLIHPYYCFLICLIGLWFMFIGSAVIVSYYNGIENPEQRSD
jgi:hypothetical protein